MRISADRKRSVDLVIARDRVICVGKALCQNPPLPLFLCVSKALLDVCFFLRLGGDILRASESATTKRRGQRARDIALAGRGDFCRRGTALLSARKFHAGSGWVLPACAPRVATCASGL